MEEEPRQSPVSEGDDTAPETPAEVPLALRRPARAAATAGATNAASGDTKVSAPEGTDPRYIPPVLRKAEDYIEPRIGPEYQATILPAATPAGGSSSKAWGGHSKVYSRCEGKRAENASGNGPQHDVLLDEFGVFMSQKRRATRGTRIEGKPLGPGAEIVLAAYAACNYDATAVRAALPHAMAWAETPDVEPPSTPDGGPGPRARAWQTVLQAGQEYALHKARHAGARKAWLDQLCRAYAAPDALRLPPASNVPIPAAYQSNGPFTVANGGVPLLAVVKAAAAGAGAGQDASGDVQMDDKSEGAGASSSSSSSDGPADLATPSQLLASIGGAASSVLPPSAAAYLATQFRTSRVEPGEVVTSHYTTQLAQACKAFMGVADVLQAKSMEKAQGRRTRSAGPAVQEVELPLETLLAAFPVPVHEQPYLGRIRRCREQPWSEAETQAFSIAMARHGKTFAFISKNVKSRCTQLCVAYYYTSFRRTEPYADYKRFREHLGPDGVLDLHITRRDRAWFHYWRFDEEALGPALPPPVVPVPELLRIRPAEEVDRAEADTALVPYQAGGIEGAAKANGWALPLLSPGMDIVVLPHGEAVAGPPPRKPGDGAEATAPTVAGPSTGAAAVAATGTSTDAGSSHGPHAVAAEETVRALRSTQARSAAAAASLPPPAPHHLGDPLAYRDSHAPLTRDQLVQVLSGQAHVDPLGDYRRVLQHTERALMDAAGAAGFLSDDGKSHAAPSPLPSPDAVHTRATVALSDGSRAHMFSDSWVDDRYIDNESYCGICGDGGDMICCDGPCRRSFHINCLKAHDQTIRAAIKASPALQKHRWYGHLFDYDRDDWRCYGCVSGVRECFVCGNAGTEGVDLFRCLHLCGKFYHLGCLQKYPGARFYKANLFGHDIDPTTPVPLDYSKGQGQEGAGASGASVGAIVPAGAAASSSSSSSAAGASSSSSSSSSSALGTAASDGAGGLKIELDASTVPGDTAGKIAASVAIDTLNDSLRMRPADIVAAATVALRVKDEVASRQASAAAGLGKGVPSLTLTLHVPAGTSPRFSCPLHACAGCKEPFHPFHPPLYYRCHACPSAFHAPCVPRGAQRDMNEILTCPDMAAHSAKRMSALYKERSGVSRVRQPEDPLAMAEAARLRREQLASAVAAGKMRIGDNVLSRLATASSGAGAGSSSIGAALKSQYATGVWLPGAAAGASSSSGHREGQASPYEGSDEGAGAGSSLWRNMTAEGTMARPGQMPVVRGPVPLGGGASSGAGLPPRASTGQPQARPQGPKRMRISLKAVVHTESNTAYRGGANTGALAPHVQGKDAIAIALDRGARLAHVDALDEAWYAEVKRRTDLLVSKGLAKRMSGDPPPGREKVTGIKYMASLKSRRWVTRLALNEVPRRDVNLGGFDDPLEAAVAFDYGSTFYRGSSVVEHNLNYPRSPSDCRFFAPIDPWPANVANGIASGKMKGLPRWAPLAGEESVPVLSKQQIASSIERGTWEEPPEDEGGDGGDMDEDEEEGAGTGASRAAPSRPSAPVPRGLQDLFQEDEAGEGGWNKVAGLVGQGGRHKHTRSHFDDNGPGDGGDDDEDGAGRRSSAAASAPIRRAPPRPKLPPVPSMVPPRSTFIGVFPDKSWTPTEERWWAKVMEGGVIVAASKEWYRSDEEAAKVYDGMVLARRGARAMTNFHFDVKGKLGYTVVGAAGAGAGSSGESGPQPSPIAAASASGGSEADGQSAVASASEAAGDLPDATTGGAAEELDGQDQGTGMDVDGEAEGAGASSAAGASAESAGAAADGSAAKPGDASKLTIDRSLGLVPDFTRRARLNLKTTSGALTIPISRDGKMSLLEGGKRVLRGMGFDPEGQSWRDIDTAYRASERRRAMELWQSIESARREGAALLAAAAAAEAATAAASGASMPRASAGGSKAAKASYDGAGAGATSGASARARPSIVPSTEAMKLAFSALGDGPFPVIPNKDELAAITDTSAAASASSAQPPKTWGTVVRANDAEEARRKGRMKPFAPAELRKLKELLEDVTAAEASGSSTPSAAASAKAGDASSPVPETDIEPSFSEGGIFKVMKVAVAPEAAQAAAAKAWPMILLGGKAAGAPADAVTDEMRLTSYATQASGVQSSVHGSILPLFNDYLLAMPSGQVQGHVKAKRVQLLTDCRLDCTGSDAWAIKGRIVAELKEVRHRLSEGARLFTEHGPSAPGLPYPAGQVGMLPPHLYEAGAVGLGWFLEGCERWARQQSGQTLPNWAVTRDADQTIKDTFPPAWRTVDNRPGTHPRPNGFYKAAQFFMEAQYVLWRPGTCTLISLAPTNTVGMKAPEGPHQPYLPALLAPNVILLNHGRVFRDKDGRVLNEPLGQSTQFAFPSYTYPGRYTVWDGQYLEVRHDRALQGVQPPGNHFYLYKRLLMGRLRKLQTALEEPKPVVAADLFRNFDGLSVDPATGKVREGPKFPLERVPHDAQAWPAYTPITDQTNSVFVRMTSMRESDKVHVAFMGYDAPHPAQVMLATLSALASAEALAIQGALSRMRTAYAKPDQGKGGKAGQASSLESMRAELITMSERLLLVSPERYGLPHPVKLSIEDGFRGSAATSTPSLAPGERMYCVCRHVVCTNTEGRKGNATLTVPKVDGQGRVIEEPNQKEGRAAVLEHYLMRHEGSLALHPACPNTGPDACKLCLFVASLGPTYKSNRGGTQKPTDGAGAGASSSSGAGAASSSSSAAAGVDADVDMGPARGAGARAGASSSAAAGAGASSSSSSATSSAGDITAYSADALVQWLTDAAAGAGAGASAGASSSAASLSSAKALPTAWSTTVETSLPQDPYLVATHWSRLMRHWRAVVQMAANTRGTRHDDDVLCCVAENWDTPSTAVQRLVGQPPEALPAAMKDPRPWYEPREPGVAAGPRAWRFPVLPDVKVDAPSLSRGPGPMDKALVLRMPKETAVIDINNDTTLAQLLTGFIKARGNTVPLACAGVAPQYLHKEDFGPLTDRPQGKAGEGAGAAAEPVKSGRGRKRKADTQADQDEEAGASSAAGGAAGEDASAGAAATGSGRGSRRSAGSKRGRFGDDYDMDG